MAENNEFLQVKNLVVEYKSDGQIVHAVNGVNLKLGKGRTLGLVGETGAGKTTTVAAKVKYLVDKQGIDPKQILVISFTNKAVNAKSIPRESNFRTWPIKPPAKLPATQ